MLNCEGEVVVSCDAQAATAPIATTVVMSLQRESTPSSSGLLDRVPKVLCQAVTYKAFRHEISNVGWIDPEAAARIGEGLVEQLRAGVNRVDIRCRRPGELAELAYCAQMSLGA